MEGLIKTENREGVLLIKSKDFEEGVLSFIEKREPKFQGK